MNGATETRSHRDLEALKPLTEWILGCAIEVHRHLGPGLLESVYEEALAIEFRQHRLRYERQVRIPALYKGRRVGDYRPDFVVEGAVVVEVKSVARMEPVFVAQVLTYLKVTRARVGLLLNFNTPVLVDGVRRLVR